MHWLLDVHFDEDFCRSADANEQQNLNIARKAALNYVKDYKVRTNSKRPISKVMLDCEQYQVRKQKKCPLCGGKLERAKKDQKVNIKA